VNLPRPYGIIGNWESGQRQISITRRNFTGLGRQDMGLPLRKAESMDGEVAPYNYSAFHYELDVLKLGDVGKRISGDGNDVRIIARLY
jgi:hypothetical protein